MRKDAAPESYTSKTTHPSRQPGGPKSHPAGNRSCNPGKGTASTPPNHLLLSFPFSPIITPSKGWERWAPKTRRFGSAVRDSCGTKLCFSFLLPLPFSLPPLPSFPFLFPSTLRLRLPSFRSSQTILSILFSSISPTLFFLFSTLIVEQLFFLSVQCSEL